MNNVRRGLPGGRYKPLTDQDILRIHETSLKVFDEIGIQVNSAPARELFAQAGAQVDESSGIVKISASLVDELIHKAPPIVKLCGRAAKLSAQHFYQAIILSAFAQHKVLAFDRIR